MEPRGDHKTIRIIVHGEVQGVGFRWFTRRAAQELGVSGTVANLPDGTVRIVARGTPRALEQLQSSVRKGPPHSTVTRVEIVELQEMYTGNGFEVVRA